MPNFTPILSDDILAGLKNLLEDKPSQEWYCCSRTEIRDTEPEEPFPFDDQFDVIFYETGYHGHKKGCLIDHETFEIIHCPKDKSVKRKARTLNLNGKKPILGQGEWTFAEVREIRENHRCFDFVAFKKSAAEEVVTSETKASIFHNDFKNKLAEKYRVGVCLNRIVFQPLKTKYDAKNLGKLLADTFAESPKVKIDDDCLVLTASDDHMFSGLQILITSIVLSHEVEVVVYDLGLSKENRDWLESTGVTIREPEDKHIVIPKDNYGWQTWNKPMYIASSPRRYTLWIDADACVLRNLRPAFDIIREKGLLSTADNIANVYTNDPMGCLMNDCCLYEELPTPSMMCRNHPNAGIIGVDLESEVGSSIMREWIFCIKEAAKNPQVFKGCKWHDQGAYMWALEKLCVSDLVRKDSYWNDGQTWNDFGRNFLSHTSDLLEMLKIIDSGIVHFAGRFKPWRDDA